MPAARYWRAVGLEAHAGGDLELSALHVYHAGGRADAGATLTSTIAPTVGALANLQDSDFGTTARFAAEAVSSPGFALRWDFGTPVDVYGVRAAGPVAAEFLKSLTLQYSEDGVAWGEFAAELGDFVYPGATALTAAPTSAPWIYSQPGVWWDALNGGVLAWRLVAMSANGKKILSGGVSVNLRTSEDGGNTWTVRASAGSRAWYSGAVSADGQTMIAGVGGGANIGSLWTSGDGGATWVERTSAGVRSWSSVAISADGQKMLAAATSSSLWTSDNGGDTWVERTAAGARSWGVAAMSADGQKMFAGPNNGGNLWTSNNGGATWVERTSAGVRSLVAAAMSADGQKILAAEANNSGLYLSSDGGASWVATSVAGALRSWRGIDMSSDGQRMVASELDGRLWSSSDGGATWSARVGAGVRAWHPVAMSSDGRNIAAGGSGDYLRIFAERDPMFADPPLRTIEADTPEFFASSQAPDFTTIKLPDVMPWRDMEFAGNGKVTGTVKEKNTPANTPLRRRVRLVRELDGLQIRETWSDAATGAYAFQQIDERHKYSVISYDHLGNYRAVIADSLTPETLI